MNEDPFTALVPVVEACDQLGIPYYVGGSLASSLHGVPRATNDVDVIAVLRPQHADALVQRLSATYYIDAHMIIESLRKNIPSNLIHLATMVKIDLYGERSMPFTTEAMARAASQTLPGCSTPIRFASAEDVVLAKLKWYRDGGERSERQWNDLLGILRVQADGLNQEYLDRWLARLDVVDLFVRVRAHV